MAFLAEYSPLDISAQNPYRDRLWCVCSQFASWKTSPWLECWSPRRKNHQHGNGPSSPVVTSSTVLWPADHKKWTTQTELVFCPNHGHDWYRRSSSQIAVKGDQERLGRTDCKCLLENKNQFPHPLGTTMFVGGKPLC